MAPHHFLSGPALSSLVTDRVALELRERAYSLHVWVLNCGFAIGPLFASWLSSLSFALVFYLEVVLLAAVAVALVPTLRETPRPWAGRTAHAPPGRGARGDVTSLAFASVLGTVGRDRVLVIFTAVMTLYLVVYQQGTTTLPVVMSQGGFSVPAYGALLTINGLILCLFQLPLVRLLERMPKTTVLGWAVVLTAAGYLVQAFATQWWHYAAAVVLWTVGELGVFPVAATVVAYIAPPELRATYQGLYSICWPAASSRRSSVACC